MEKDPEKQVFVKNRYSDFTYVSNDEELKESIDYVIEGLGDEEFSRPDEEHATIDVGHPNGWAMETHLDGVIRLYHDTGESEAQYLYQQNIPPEQLRQIYLQIGRGQIEEVLKLDWKKSSKELKPIDRLYYVYSSHPDMSNLHRAASSGNLEWAKEALQKGNDINGKTKFDETPLHHAVLAEEIEMCQFLIEAGADVNARDRNGESVLSYANTEAEFIVSMNKIRSLLIKHGAKK